jgi:hypothetical protein
VLLLLPCCCSPAAPATWHHQFARPEDGAWDPDRLGHFWFATTASFSGVTKLWRLEFDDLLNNPTRGGKAFVVVQGQAGNSSGALGRPKMMDNVAVHKGRVLMQVRVPQWVPAELCWLKTLFTAADAGSGCSMLRVLAARHAACCSMLNTAVRCLNRWDSPACII